MPAPKKYSPAHHDSWAWSLAIRGATDQEIADAFGVSRQTLIRWSWTKDDKGDKILTSFGEALQSGKEPADAKVERKMFERIMGYSYEEVKRFIKYDENGRSIIKKTEITVKHIPPNEMLIMYWLNNRKRKTGEWSQRQDVNVSFGDDTIRDAVRELTLDEARAKLAAIRSGGDEK